MRRPVGVHQAKTSEAFSIVDAASRTHNTAVLVSEELSALDATSRLANLHVSASDVSSLVATASGFGAHFGAASDASNLTAAAAGLGAHLGTASEFFSLRDAGTRLPVAHVAMVAENLPLITLVAAAKLSGGLLTPVSIIVGQP